VEDFIFNKMIDRSVRDRATVKDAIVWRDR